jgi:hypothetical protein
MMQPPRPFEPPRSWRIKRTAHERVLEQWRGIDLREQEKARAPSGKSVAEVLPGVLKEIRLDRRQSDLEILKVWNNLMDPTVVAHARPVNLVKGTLFVTVDSSVWMEEMVRYRRREILQRLQHSFGSDLIRRLSFRVG